MARKEKKYHFIYKTTNLLSGKYYIGMHSTHDLDDGYLGSGNRLRRAIKKYGEENFIREIIEFCDTREELRLRESEVVNLDEIAKENCMNLKVGGEGGFSSEQQRENAKKSNEKQKILRETDLGWVEKRKQNSSNGQKLAYKKGRKMVLPDWNGRTHSNETKEKMRKTKNNGSDNSQFGTCWITKEETNKKIKKEDLESYLLEGWVKGRKGNK